MSLRDSTGEMVSSTGQVTTLVLDAARDIVCKDVVISDEVAKNIRDGVGLEFRKHPETNMLEECTVQIYQNNNSTTTNEQTAKLSLSENQCTRRNASQGTWKISYDTSHGTNNVNDNVLTDNICTPIGSIKDNKINCNGQECYFKVVSSVPGAMAFTYGEQSAGLTIEELQDAITQIKGGKAIGPDGMEIEILKNTFGTSVITRLYNIMKKAWETCNIPKSWVTGNVSLIPKKGDLGNVNNYRGICVMSLYYKIMMRIIYNRVANVIDVRMADSQYAYRSGRSTVDAIHVIRRIQDNINIYGNKCFALYIDMKKCFDKVSTECMFHALEMYGVDPHIVALVKTIYSQSELRYMINSELSEPIKPIVGIRQGCSFSPVAFTALMDLCIRDAKLDELGGVKLIHKTCKAWKDLEQDVPKHTLTNILVYADDIVLLADTQDELRALFNRLSTKLSEYGFDIHEDKTVVQCYYRKPTSELKQKDSCKCTSKLTKKACCKGKRAKGVTSAKGICHQDQLSGHERIVIEYNGKFLRQVSNFVYLGSNISSDCTFKGEMSRVKSRLYFAYRQNRKALRSKASHTLKKRVYMTYILSRGVYGLHCATLKKDDLKEIEVITNSIKRSALGVKLVKGQPSNREINKMLNVENTTTTIERYSLRHFGHICRQDEHSIAKRVTLSVPQDSTKFRGGQMKTWLKNQKELTKRCNIDEDRLKYVIEDRCEFRKAISLLVD